MVGGPSPPPGGIVRAAGLCYPRGGPARVRAPAAASGSIHWRGPLMPSDPTPRPGPPTAKQPRRRPGPGPGGGNWLWLVILLLLVGMFLVSSSSSSGALKWSEFVRLLNDPEQSRAIKKITLLGNTRI